MFRNMHLTRPRKAPSFTRLAKIEQLERRDMLTAGPRVVAVEVASTTWSPDLISYFQNPQHLSVAPYLDRKGYDIPLGSSAQSDALPWTNLDQIRIKFDTGVSVSSGALSVSGVNVVAYAFKSFHYDPQTLWATWTLATPIGSDRIQLDLDANGARPVTDLFSNALDGEWTNNASTVSGNGTAGGDFEFIINVLPGDVNGSSTVAVTDYTAILSKVGLSTTSTGYNPKYDLDGNGTIDVGDLTAALDRVLQTLPTGTPVGVYDDAPTTTLFGVSTIDSNTSNDLAIALTYGFADAESGSNGLTYSIVSYDKPDLVSSISINQSTKELVVHAASGASGRETVVVRATDASGLFVDTPVRIDINRPAPGNEPPKVEDFGSAWVVPGTRYYWGRISDPDDNLTDCVIYIYGDFFDTTVVSDDEGNFAFAVILDMDAWGWEYAVVSDPQGMWSDDAFGDFVRTS